MHIKKMSLSNILLPLALGAYLGPHVIYLDRVFSVNTRWIFLIVLALFLLLRKRLVTFFGSPLFSVLFLYLSWCFFSFVWSDVPTLSFLKSSLFLVMTIVFVSAGIEWVKSHDSNNCLSYLSVATFIALAAGFLGKLSPGSFDYFGIVNGYMYRGLAHGANMFGMMAAMSLPLLFWKLYTQQGGLKKRGWRLFLVISVYVFIALSLSRAALLAAILILFAFLFSLSATKKMYLSILFSLVLIMTVIISPSTVSSIGDKYIYKYNLTQKSLFATRAKPWTQSYNSAEQGGWIGLGYGVSYGENNFEFKRGLSAIGYGREKGNSQLAIIEETGFIGLIFYALVLLVIVGKLMKLYFWMNKPPDKVLIGIIIGTFFGLLAHSGFEAWWTAPGSPESIFFWSLVGIIRGLEIVKGRQRVYDTYGLEAKNRNGMAGLAY